MFYYVWVRLSTFYDGVAGFILFSYTLLCFLSRFITVAYVFVRFSHF